MFSLNYDDKDQTAFLGNLEVDVGESEGCCGMKERGEDILGFMLKYLHYQAQATCINNVI